MSYIGEEMINVMNNDPELRSVKCANCNKYFVKCESHGVGLSCSDKCARELADI